MALTDQQHRYLVLAVEDIVETYRCPNSNASGSDVINEAVAVMAESFLELIDVVSRLGPQPEIDWSKMTVPSDLTNLGGLDITHKPPKY